MTSRILKTITLLLVLICGLGIAHSHASGQYMKRSDYTIQRLNVETTTLGESPYWDVSKQTLYYVDIAERKVCCYIYNEDQSYCAVNEDSTLADNIGFIVPVARKRDNYVIAVGTRICEINWVPQSATFSIVQTLTDVGNTSINRINDGKADPMGRLFFGTMNSAFAGRTGSFYRLSKIRGGYELVELLDEVGVSNGLAWSNDHKRLYYIDSINQTVTGYNYSKGTGDITSPRTIVNTGELGLTIPDGMTIDKNDRLYIVIYNGNCVLVVNSKSGAVEHKIIIPDGTNTTSAAFGGPNMNEVFVTSGSSDIESIRDTSGGLYKITFSCNHIRGREMFKVEV